jgi:phage terminase large subunit
MGRAVDIPLIPVLEPLLQPSRYKGLYGGRGGAKSHAFADLAIERSLMQKGSRIVCIREYQTTLEHSVKKLLEDKLQLYGLGLIDGFRVMDSCIETPGDGIIIFQGMQAHNADSIKSLEGYDVAWVEEAQSLSQRSLDLLRPTIRKDGSELWFSWNPEHADDPVDKLLRCDPPPPDSIIIRTSFKDNPFFSDVLRREMEWDRARDPEKYAHIWLGEYEQRSESRVFKNFVVQEFDEVDTVHHYGADWGYSQDPSTLVRMRVDERKLYITHEAYRVGVEIDDLPALFDTVPGSRENIITADSARPETISWMRRHGFPYMRPARKGANSVKEGVILLQNFDIIIHPRCTHTVDEFSNYRYLINVKTNEVVLPLKLEDKENHIIDPTRYGLEDYLINNADQWLVA